MSIFHADEMPMEGDGITSMTGDRDNDRLMQDNGDNIMHSTINGGVPGVMMPISEDEAMPMNGNGMLSLDQGDEKDGLMRVDNIYDDVDIMDKKGGAGEEYEDELDIADSTRSRSSRTRERMIREKYEDYDVDYDINNMDGEISQGQMDEDYERNLCAKILIALAVLIAILFPALVIITIVHVYYVDKNANAAANPTGKTVKPLDPPPLNIEDLCSYSNLQTDVGYESCLQTCQAAICCEFPVNLDLSCVYGNEMKCLKYHEHCVKLDYPVHGDGGDNNDTQVKPPSATQSSTSLQKASSALPQYCAHDSLASPDGFSVCQHSCNPGKCCYDKTGSVPSCASDPECEGYAPCFAMASLVTTDSNVKLEVDDKCTQDNILNVKGRDNCLDACSHSLCCYAEDIVGPCPDKDSEEFCKQYESCKNVFDVTKEQIDALCDPITGDDGTCKHLCYPARCCFDQGSCFDAVSKDDCNIYDSCVTVFPAQDDKISQNNPKPTSKPFDSSSSSFSSSSTSVSSTLSPETYTLDQVRDACLNHNNIGGAGRETLCEKVCKPGICCFDDNVLCPFDVDCLIYEACSGTTNTVSDQLGDACSAEQRAIDKTLCVQLCAKAACCFTLDENRSCLEAEVDILCAEYNACDVVFYSE